MKALRARLERIAAALANRTALGATLVWVGDRPEVTGTEITKAQAAAMRPSVIFFYPENNRSRIGTGNANANAGIGGHPTESHPAADLSGCSLSVSDENNNFAKATRPHGAQMTTDAEFESMAHAMDALPKKYREFWAANIRHLHKVTREAEATLAHVTALVKMGQEALETNEKVIAATVNAMTPEGGTN